MLSERKLEDYFNQSNQQHIELNNEALDSDLDGGGATAALPLPEKSDGYDPDVPRLFRSLITKEFEDFQDNFREWINRSPMDKDASITSLPEALAEIFYVQKEYLQLIDLFASLHRTHIDPEQLTDWKQEVTTAFNQLILQFTVRHSKAEQRNRDARQHSIAELNAPLILLTERTGVISLTGKVTGHEARIVHEKTLKKCFDAHLEYLFIDLSGVRMTDPEGAQQLFRLFNGLKILGVKTILTGISPGIAKVFIQQNFNSNNIEISSTLIQALKMHNLKNPR